MPTLQQLTKEIKAQTSRRRPDDEAATVRTRRPRATIKGLRKQLKAATELREQVAAARPSRDNAASKAASND